MKKIFLLFMSLAVLSSCSNDDDTGNGEDSILGTWGIVEINNTGDVPITINECSSQSQITFNSDDTAFSEYYTQTQAGCTVDANEGGWSNEGDSKYSFRIPFFGTQQGTVEFSEDYSEFTFYPDALSQQNTNIVFEKR